MNDLVASLKVLTTEAVSSLSLPTPAGGFSAPSVFAGGLPRPTLDDTSPAPYVMLRVTGGTDDRSKRLLTARILCAIWNEDMEAGISAINNLTALVLSLQRQKGFTPYKLDLPAKWSMGDEQGDHPHPFYFSNIIFQFLTTPVIGDKS